MKPVGSLAGFVCLEFHGGRQQGGRQQGGRQQGGRQQGAMALALARRVILRNEFTQPSVYSNLVSLCSLEFHGAPLQRIHRCNDQHRNHVAWLFWPFPHFSARPFLRLFICDFARDVIDGLARPGRWRPLPSFGETSPSSNSAPPRRPRSEFDPAIHPLPFPVAVAAARRSFSRLT